MEQMITTQQRQSSRLLIALGGLWLIIAAAYLVYQLANPTVEVRWETATEIQTAGFNLFRGTNPDDISSIVNQDGLIASHGEAVSGATYTYIDNSVEVGQTYYYMLEEIEYDGGTNRYDADMFTYKVPYVTLFTAVITAASLIVGLALIVTGLKEDRNL